MEWNSVLGNVLVLRCCYHFDCRTLAPNSQTELRPCVPYSVICLRSSSDPSRRSALLGGEPGVSQNADAVNRGAGGAVRSAGGALHGVTFGHDWSL